MRHVCIYFRLCSCSRNSSHSSRKATNHPPALATLRTGQKKNKKAGRQVRKDFLGKLGSPYTRHAPLLCFPCHEVFSCVTHLSPVSLRFYVVVAPPEKKKGEEKCEMFHKRKEHCIFGKGFVRFSLAPPSSQCFFSHSRRPSRTNLLGCFPVPPHPTTHTTHTHLTKPQRRRRRQPRTAHGRGGNCSKNEKKEYLHHKH
ncbi:hypothetical protein CCHR01_16679 [Colletotrichum chrysophilum]|uniref:Uncharacterized protein n=1 Tax=Colletotrichum chrysophilum TaxID=1836956 RepID=A0AAD9A3A4_9PEZI|nr:hypothetical protein CCHR01_16679 [Colletotrichum chrysophilum]